MSYGMLARSKSGSSTAVVRKTGSPLPRYFTPTQSRLTHLAAGNYGTPVTSQQHNTSLSRSHSDTNISRTPGYCKSSPSREATRFQPRHRGLANRCPPSGRDMDEGDLNQWNLNSLDAAYRSDASASLSPQTAETAAPPSPLLGGNDQSVDLRRQQAQMLRPQAAPSRDTFAGAPHVIPQRRDRAHGLAFPHEPIAAQGRREASPERRLDAPFPLDANLVHTEPELAIGKLNEILDAKRRLLRDVSTKLGEKVVTNVLQAHAAPNANRIDTSNPPQLGGAPLQVPRLVPGNPNGSPSRATRFEEKEAELMAKCPGPDMQSLCANLRESIERKRTLLQQLQRV